MSNKYQNTILEFSKENPNNIHKLHEFLSSLEDNPTITPYKVDVKDGIDYNKLIQEFGTEPINDALLARFQKLGLKTHYMLTRGIFFSHRNLNAILDHYEKSMAAGKGPGFYLYTGRGPSSESMHIGHLIPFIFTKYLQDVFNVPVMIQMTDDEKFLVKEALSLEDVNKMLISNVKDIIALGFNPEKTFIFSDMQFMGGKFYENIISIQKKITVNQATHCFGVEGGDNIGKLSFVAIQAAPSFPSTFPEMLKGDEMCLIPCAIDQDPYFRITRDVATRLKFNKPSLVHSKFLPAMTGNNTKMSSSETTHLTIFLTDTPEMIENKIKKNAFSGAPSTLKELREHGANLEIDVSYQYLIFFLENEDELLRIRNDYSRGIMTTGEVKNILIKVLQEIVGKHQINRRKVTNDLVKLFMTSRKLESMSLADH